MNYIERNIKSGSYVVADTFDRDILRMFQNFWRYFGRDSYEGTAARVMRQTYNNIKPEYLAQLTDVLGSEGLREYKMTMTNLSGGEEGGDAGMVTGAIFKLVNFLKNRHFSGPRRKSYRKARERTISTLQSNMNVKLIQLRFWH